ncbi:hypothetical protein AVEN_231370-1 [Araneus ventricosus]|uniref:Uncharacterized protein n=1 Tax=Araneus ventricosus TaxID=182803 RepID=A0A4Y2K2G2_ARAVE|nr:hypothetical protein AVEN_231370-1 [Araneus ventricosus]
MYVNYTARFVLSSLYTAGQLPRKDDTITHSNYKMKECRMGRVRISAGHSKKKCSYANFLSHDCSSRDSSDKRFKGFDACRELLFRVKVLQERFD